MPPRKPRPPKAAKPAKSAAPREPGAPRLLLACDVRVGFVPAGLPVLPEALRPVAASAGVAAWENLVKKAVKGADAVLLTGRVFDPAADVRAERAFRTGLATLADADVPVFAHTAEPLPDVPGLVTLAPTTPDEVELDFGGAALAAVRTLAGPAAFPVPDGLPVVGLLSGDAAADAGDGCDLLVPAAGPRRTVRADSGVTHHPGSVFAGGACSLVTLPQTAGAGGLAVKELGVNPVRFLSLSADLPDEPADLPAELRRRAADEPARGERLRVVDWTLHVGGWGDRLLDPAAAADLARSLNDTAGKPAALHRVVAVPHDDRLAGGEGDGAAFLETLAHFDPLGEADALPKSLAAVPVDPHRVRRLAARFALPLTDAD